MFRVSFRLSVYIIFYLYFGISFSYDDLFCRVSASRAVIPLQFLTALKSVFMSYYYHPLPPHPALFTRARIDRTISRIHSRTDTHTQTRQRETESERERDSRRPLKALTLTSSSSPSSPSPSPLVNVIRRRCERLSELTSKLNRLLGRSRVFQWGRGGQGRQCQIASKQSATSRGPTISAINATSTCLIAAQSPRLSLRACQPEMGA